MPPIDKADLKVGDIVIITATRNTRNGITHFGEIKVNKLEGPWRYVEYLLLAKDDPEGHDGVWGVGDRIVMLETEDAYLFEDAPPELRTLFLIQSILE